jgi:transcriptional regulator with XRE-family HTH domain
MKHLSNTSELIIQLKEVRKEKNWSFGKIMKELEKNDVYISKSTLSRVFADGSENETFRFDETIRPIANVLLDVDTIEETDDLDVRALKLLLKYKSQMIDQLERQIQQEKMQTLEEVEKERQRNAEFVEFLKNQLSYKDKRMDEFMQSVKEKDTQLAGLLDHITNCPFRKAK